MLDRSTGLMLVALGIAACSVAPPSERAEDVATSADAIIDGRISGEDQDSVVLLFHAAPGGQTCTATLVAPNLLLTARHCVGSAASDGTVEDWVPSDIRVFVGRGAFATLRDDESKHATIGRELVVPASRSFYPDIALVVLEAPLAAPIASIRLERGVEIGETVDVAGYGLDATGKRPAVRMKRDGLEIFQTGPGRSRIGEPLGSGEFVFGEAACSGDSGGPAFSSLTGAVVGVASRVGNGTEPRADAPAAFCVGDDADDVYTDLTPVADVVARGFAAAGATPRLEDRRAAQATGGQLARSPLSDDESNTAPASAGRAYGGCQTSPLPAPAPLGGAGGMGLAVAAIALRLDRRRTRSRRRTNI